MISSTTNLFKRKLTAFNGLKKTQNGDSSHCDKVKVDVIIKIFKLN